MRIGEKLTAFAAYGGALIMVGALVSCGILADKALGQDFANGWATYDTPIPIDQTKVPLSIDSRSNLRTIDYTEGNFWVSTGNLAAGTPVVVSSGPGTLVFFYMTSNNAVATDVILQDQTAATCPLAGAIFTLPAIALVPYFSNPYMHFSNGLVVCHSVGGAFIKFTAAFRPDL